jgi:hypothetical protein
MYTKSELTRAPSYTFTVSARGKPSNVPVFAFLRRNFGTVPLAQIESLFGFVEQSTLYGGRYFMSRELSDRDVRQLNNAGIGLRIPLTNHYVTRAEYDSYSTLLDKYHSAGNSVIATNDNLAGWIREDFPRYKVDASVIKNINTREKLDKAFKIYDEIVLPMEMNEDFAFLRSIEEKDRITLFANAGCAFTCPSRICYVSVSKLNKQTGNEQFRCSRSLKQREVIGMIDFELEPLIELGFRHFKLLRAMRGQLTGF